MRDVDNAVMTTRISLLKERHQALDDEIDASSERRWLSGRERMRVKELKVRRLRLRDQIARLEVAERSNEITPNVDDT